MGARERSARKRRSAGVAAFWKAKAPWVPEEPWKGINASAGRFEGKRDWGTGRGWTGSTARNLN